MSLLETLESKEDDRKVSEEKRKLIRKEVEKLREYEKLGFIGE